VKLKRRQVAFARELTSETKQSDKLAAEQPSPPIKSLLKGSSFKRSEQRDPSFGPRMTDKDNGGRESYLKWTQENGRMDHVAFGIDYLQFDQILEQQE
jgi:hypothetical protein